MPQQNHVLIASADYEKVTHIIHEWSRDVVHNAVDAGNSVYVMNQEQYSRDNLRSGMLNLQPAFFFGMGHGYYFLTTGYDSEVVIQSDTTYYRDGQEYHAPDVNMDITNNVVVYLLSCQTGEKLGIDMINKGTKSFIGYDRDFVFFSSSNAAVKKIYEGFFMRPAMKIADSLVQGKTTKQAWQDGINEFQKSLDILFYSPDPNAPIMINILQDDMDALRLYGDENAVVSVSGPAPPPIEEGMPPILIYGLMAGALWKLLK